MTCLIFKLSYLKLLRKKQKVKTTMVGKNLAILDTYPMKTYCKPSEQLFFPKIHISYILVINFREEGGLSRQPSICSKYFPRNKTKPRMTQSARKAGESIFIMITVKKQSNITCTNFGQNIKLLGQWWI